MSPNAIYTLAIVLVGVLCFAIGYLVGDEEDPLEREIRETQEWHHHAQSALWVARRPTPGTEGKVES